MAGCQVGGDRLRGCPLAWGRSLQQLSHFKSFLMKYIASKMAKAYCDDGFWIDLQILAEHIMDGKKG